MWLWSPFLCPSPLLGWRGKVGLTHAKFYPSTSPSLPIIAPPVAFFLLLSSYTLFLRLVLPPQMAQSWHSARLSCENTKRTLCSEVKLDVIKNKSAQPQQPLRNPRSPLQNRHHGLHLPPRPSCNTVCFPPSVGIFLHSLHGGRYYFFFL